MIRRFRLVRIEDVSGVSGTGHIASGLKVGRFAFLWWHGSWPTIVLHLKGVQSIEAIHGHQGRTKIEWA